ncbi:alpha/beta hydrolase [Burkholderia sp. Cy-637]|uniref:alpha/beta fold hydrolase n=1 Tax=Burkholderia sp. Cy-637 TaxID=2608327 RepID=UPI00141ED8F3|nr:alpha/beta hydrolase [Burkholderia sp. Cy-637]NIF87818.1 alpha/beta hydrolase [Burkholderia sp. Cy-637]
MTQAHSLLLAGLIAAAQLLPSLSQATEASQHANAAYGAELEGAAYPFPLRRFDFSSQQQSLHMAYMDVRPVKPSGQTAVLLHGKNFCSASWRDTIRDMSAEGYRVIAIDQIGFCKSSKPAHYQYTFQQLADNTRRLLQSIGVGSYALIGHSTGGMLAARYALMYPREVGKLVLVDPVGLEDWKAKGVPAQTVDQWYAKDLRTSAEGIRKYEQAVYYNGQWDPRFEPWVRMLAGLYLGPGKERVAWNSALIFDMIYTQPVIYELGKLQPPTLLMIGDKDSTAIGLDVSPPEVRASLGHYPELARDAVRRIPHAALIEFPAMGHAPQIQDPKAFDDALLGWLSSN